MINGWADSVILLNFKNLNQDYGKTVYCSCCNGILSPVENGYSLNLIFLIIKTTAI